MTQVLHNGVPNRIEEAKKLQVDRTALGQTTLYHVYSCRGRLSPFIESTI